MTLFNVLAGVLSWETAPSVLSPASHMEDALHVVNTSITNYLSTNRDLGDVPSSCSVLVQKEKANFWEDKSLEWWQPGIDLYE